MDVLSAEEGEGEYNNGQRVYLSAIMVVRKKRVHSPFLRYASFVLFSAYLPHSTLSLTTLVYLINDQSLIYASYFNNLNKQKPPMF